MSNRALPLLATLATLAAAVLAGCAAPAPDENVGGNGNVCAPASELGGESGHEPGTTGSGTGDITTADGGDPSRSSDAPGAAQPCGPGASDDGAAASDDTDGASTGLGEPGGGFSTEPQAGV